MSTVVTGIAGFIGMRVARALCERGEEVVGLDSVNDYYDPRLKFARLEHLGIHVNDSAPGHLCRSDRYENLSFVRKEIEDAEGLIELFQMYGVDRVCHFAGQAGVRYSLENPRSYVSSNLVGFANLLEACREISPKHLVFASSSSVYGLNGKFPFSVHHATDHPASLYAATKKSNELMAHAYSHLFGIPCTGLRFFTVYGPWGRPDMAPFLFARAILRGETIKVFNKGRMRRDFTYIDDVCESVVRVLDKPPLRRPDWKSEELDPATSSAPYRLLNVGNNQPVELMSFINALEEAFGKKANLDMVEIQPGDVEATWADSSELESLVAFAPSTALRSGVERFAQWYMQSYYPGLK